MTDTELDLIGRQIDSFVCALRYIHGVYWVHPDTFAEVPADFPGALQLDVHRPFYHAAYCLDWAGMMQ